MMAEKKTTIKKQEKAEKLSPKNIPTLQLKSEREIAEDFAEKVYQKFDKIIKSVILFGSQIKQNTVVGSDIDIIILVDDATIQFDERFIMWYREELGKIISANPYKRDLHINTVKLTTWWEDLYRGDPTIINIIRYGEAMIDVAGFFGPFKILLQEGKIRTTPESMYVLLNRVPSHILRSKQSELGAIEGVYWAMAESAQALLMAIKVLPPSPEHITILLREHFVEKKLLNKKYADWYKDVFELHKKIIHGQTKDIEGEIVDEWQLRAEEFFKVVLKLIDDLI
jgi:uncharacterized protein (UPF0332 family)/predicted nucleotidyltransferase